MSYMSPHVFIRSKIRASALGYAISFLMLTGLICSGVIFIASANKRLEMHYTLNEHLLFDNYTSLLHGARTIGPGKTVLLHPAGDTSEIHVTDWGAFRVVTAHTHHGNRSVSKSSMIGYTLETHLPALYLSDLNHPLKLGGNTRIEGEAFLPVKGVERGYIAGKNYSNDQLIYGGQQQSKPHLPALNPAYANLDVHAFLKKGIKADFFSKDSVFPFDTPTTVVSQVQPLAIHQHISGNIVLHSFDSIYVSPDARLENVILIAPVVRFGEGFRGSVQVIAHERIICEKNVKLLYPSMLALNETSFHGDLASASIEVHEGALVTGGILLTSQAPNFRKPVSLRIDAGATVGGLIYNSGETALYGKVIGNLYTQAFKINAGGGSYTNYLVDALISRERLPKEFLYPYWLEHMEFKNAKIISCF